MPSIDDLVRRTLDVHARVGRDRSVLLAISGIDASGKGFVAARVAQAIDERGSRAALINVDGWLSLPQDRFAEVQPGAHFYRHALRFDEMFAQLVLPLRDHRGVRVTADFAEETATAFRPHTYDFADVDVIVLEGIFLLKRAFRAHYDLTCWIECTFDTALERALTRGQEGLPPAETVRAYRTVYFPAQEIHLAVDDPRAAATVILKNDPRLADRTAA